MEKSFGLLKWLMKYLKGTIDVGILFDGMNDHKGDVLMGRCDSDFVGNVNTRKSQSVYIFTLYGSVVSYKHSLQGVVALSTTEAEFMSLKAVVKESFWLKGILGDFGIRQEAAAIGYENNSALCLARHQVYREMSKHIDVRLHFIQEEIEKG